MESTTSNKIRLYSYDMCIYHKHCLDGFTSFYIIKQYGNNPNILPVPMQHNESVSSLKGDSVLLIDICFNEEKMMTLMKNFSKITVVDHHIQAKTLYDKLKNNDQPCFELYYRDNMSACQIAWSIMMPKSEKNAFIELVGKQDLGIGWNDRPFHFVTGVKMLYRNNLYHSRTMNKLINLDSLNIDNIIMFGSEMNHTTHREYNAIIKKSGRVINKQFPFNEKIYTIMFCEESKINKGDFALYMCYMYEEIDFAIVYSHQQSGLYTGSARSTKKNINLVEIAEYFKSVSTSKNSTAGGHPQACGFVEIDLERIFPKISKTSEVFENKEQKSNSKKITSIDLSKNTINALDIREIPSEANKQDFPANHMYLFGIGIIIGFTLILISISKK